MFTGRETCAGKAISETVSGAGIGICYASALCFTVRFVLLRAKTTSQDSNADSMGRILEPRIDTFQRRELVFQPKAHFACWSHARPDSFKDSLLFLQLVYAKESLISLRKA
jgi:hypothetical protein